MEVFITLADFDIMIYIVYHSQLAKMSFDKIFDLTAGVYFYFYNTYSLVCPQKKWVQFKPIL